MKTFKYKIEFHDFWCVTSGLAGGAKADILTLKDPNGLPYVPGRTLKGLLREAAEVLQESGLVAEEWAKAFFGEREWKEGDDENDKHRPRKAGTAFFPKCDAES